MTDIGIDALHFYSPPFKLSLEELAVARGVEPEKYKTGIGQWHMSMPSPDEDIVTMGAEAAFPLIAQMKDPSSIRMLLFATESGIDHSKAAGIWVHHLLGLSSTCRVIELKQACYSATCALQLAKSFVAEHPHQQALIIASDIARYGLKTAGEPTQGAGSVAMLIAKNPRLLRLEKGSGVDTSHVMDFWRPVYMTEALVDGKFSTRIYLETLERCWNEYVKETSRTWEDHARFCFHTPFCKMADKAYERLAKINGIALAHEGHKKPLEDSLSYAKSMGNCYTAALYISLMSLMEHDTADLVGARVGCYSYGSGAVGEFFSCQVMPNYRKHLFIQKHQTMLDQRKSLSIAEYETFYKAGLPQDGSAWTAPCFKEKGFRLSGLKNHIRQYEKVLAL